MRLAVLTEEEITRARELWQSLLWRGDKLPVAWQKKPAHSGFDQQEGT